MIYLDYNATVPLQPSVRDELIRTLDIWGNPSSVHSFGRTARKLIEEARLTIAASVGAEAKQVIFTGSASEANNMALNSFTHQPILVLSCAHASLLNVVESAIKLPLDEQGLVVVERLEEVFSEMKKPFLLAVALANNETGVIQPLKEIIALARSYDCFIHCDAVQALGKLELDFSSLDIDSMAISSHKIGGPKGVGALVVRDSSKFSPLIKGGGQERNLRAGTENPIGIAGFRAAAKLIPTLLADQKRQQLLRDRWEERIQSEAPNAMIAGKNALRLANTSCVIMPGMPSQNQLMAMDLAGIAVSAGAACSSGKIAASHVLEAMGFSKEYASSAIRISFGLNTLEDHLDKCFEIWHSLYQRTQLR